MSVLKSRVLTVLTLAFFLGLNISAVSAQEKTKADKKGKDDVEKVVRKRFAEIKKLAADGKWKKLGDSMTKTAANEFCARQVISAIGIQKILDQVPVEIESLQDAADAVTEVFDEYKIDTEKLDVSSVMSIGGGRDTSKEGLKEAQKAAKKLEEQILKTLNKDGKRWGNRWQTV